MDFRRCYDKDFIYAYDLEGKPATLTIERAVAGRVKGTSGKESKKPVLYFKETKTDGDGKKRGLAICVTNGKTIASLYGNDMDSWLGKRITIYPTTTEFGGKTVECIRIKAQIPSGGNSGSKEHSGQHNASQADSTQPGALPGGDHGTGQADPVETNR